MARRKRTIVEQAVADAAKELGLPPTHWSVLRLSTMMVMLAVAQHKFSTTQSSQSAADILTLMDSITALRAEAKLNEPVQIRVKYASSYVGIANIVCPHCKMASRHELSDRPFEGREPTPAAKPMGEAPVEPQAASGGDQAPASTDGQKAPEGGAKSPDAKVVPLVTHRPGISVSSFHSQQLTASGEVPPLRHHHGGQAYVR